MDGRTAGRVGRQNEERSKGAGVPRERPQGRQTEEDSHRSLRKVVRDQGSEIRRTLVEVCGINSEYRSMGHRGRWPGHRFYFFRSLAMMEGCAPFIAVLSR